MVKSLDGIKKLTPEEIKENRKIVLRYIGEKDTELVEKKEIPEILPSGFNKVDGIKSKVRDIFKKSSLNSKDIEKKNIGLNIEKSQEKIQQEELVKKEIVEKNKRQIKEKAQAEIMIKKAKIEAEEKAKIEKSKKLQEKLKLEEEAKEGERVIRENKRLEKIKRAEEIKRIKEELKLAKIKAKEKIKIKRKKAIKIFKKNLKYKLNSLFLAVKKNFFYGILYLFIFLIFTYLFFCLLVLRFKIDNSFVKKIEYSIPVPAVITSQGIINYHDFININKNNFNNLNQKRDILANWLILNNLSKKYNLPPNTQEEDLVKSFIVDDDYNQVGFSRIKKINDLVKNINNIEELSRYADKYQDLSYYNAEDASKIFGPGILNLKDNQISDIILSPTGYYIVQVINNINGQLGIKYLFVGAKTLDQYVAEKLSKIKIFILAN